MQILVGGKIYEVLEDGRIPKRRGKGFIKQHPDKDGYLRYHIHSGKTYNFLVHRLVWEYHNGSTPEGMTVDHKNSDKQNNHISNLQLLTPKDNAIKGNAQNWRVVNPAGEEFAVYNLEKFCRDNNLHAGHMREIAKGKLRQYKGWTCYVD